LSKINIDKNQRKLLILIVTAILIVIGDFFFLIGPQLNVLRKINPKLTTMLRDVESAEFDIQQKANFQRRYKLAKEKMLNIDKRIPKEKEISPILNEISMVSKESHVKITQLKPLKKDEDAVLKTEAGDYYRLPIYIDAFCGYHQLGMFLNKIEYSDIFMKMVEIEMIKNKDNSEKHQVSLIVDTFIIKK